MIACFSATRQWQMPGVRALPEPQFRLAGMERVGFWLEPQIRNAVYGYLAEEDKQSTAGYMRAVVMPGMAKLLHRPAYDFTRPPHPGELYDFRAEISERNNLYADHPEKVAELKALLARLRADGRSAPVAAQK